MRTRKKEKLTKISPVITHATGPQEIAKKAIYLCEKNKYNEKNENKSNEKNKTYMHTNAINTF